MVGRKPLIEPSKVVVAVMKFKVVMNDNGENYSIVVATNPLWYEISRYLNGCMSGAALHTFVYRDAHGIKEKLGFVFNQNDKKNNLLTEENNPHKDGENMQQNSEAAPHITVKLFDIPKVIIYNEASYKLRGVLNYRPGNSFLRSSIGYYTTYARRCGGNWEIYDDLKKKPLSIAENTMASCEILIYSV